MVLKSIVLSLIWFGVQFWTQETIKAILFIKSLHFLPLIPFSNEFVLCIYLECQRIVSWWAEGLEVWFASCSGSHCWFVGIVAGGHHSNLPLPFCRWGSFVPIHIFLPLEFPGFGVLFLWGIWIGGCGCVIVIVIVIIIGQDQPVFSDFKQISWHFPCLRPWGTCADWSIL